MITPTQIHRIVNKHHMVLAEEEAEAIIDEIEGRMDNLTFIRRAKSDKPDDQEWFDKEVEAIRERNTFGRNMKPWEEAWIKHNPDEVISED